MNGGEGPVDKNPFRLHGDRNTVGDAFNHCPIELFIFEQCHLYFLA